MPHQNTAVTMAAAQPVTMAMAAGTAGSKVQLPGFKSGALTEVLSKQRLQELVRELDPTEQLDDDVEEILLTIADDFIESTVSAACQLAKHRKGSTVEVRDIQLHLEKNWNMWLPGFGTDELKPHKRSALTEAHRQRMALIRKTLKKY